MILFVSALFLLIANFIALVVFQPQYALLNAANIMLGMTLGALIGKD